MSDLNIAINGFAICALIFVIVMSVLLIGFYFTNGYGTRLPKEKSSLKWVDVNSNTKPAPRQTIITYCPGWCDTYYAVAFWDGTRFDYCEALNDDFNNHVKQWAVLPKYPRGKS
jgi:hypothetical protein